MNIIEDGIAKGFLRPLPPIALIIIVYQPLETLTKVIATGQLEYSKELVKELEESFGMLLESFDSIALQGLE